MDIINSLHTDIKHAEISLTGISSFSKRDKFLIIAVILIPMILNNLLYWFLQDVVITQFAVTVFGYILAPAVLNKIIKKDVYILMDFREHFPISHHKIGFLFVFLAVAVPTVLLSVGLFLGVLGVSSFNLLAPYFNRVFLNYAYGIVAAVQFCAIHPYFESRFYFGVVDSILPGGTFLRIFLAFLLTINYIGFSFALVGVNAASAIIIALIFASFLCFSLLLWKKGVRTAMFLYVLVSAAVFVVFAVFIILRHYGSYNKGVNIVMPNPRNIFG